MHFKNESGFSLIELLVATVIIMLGIIAVMAVFPAGWATTTRADRVGQSSEIMHREMEAAEVSILNRCNPVVAGQVVTPNVFSGGQAVAQPGDMSYTVTRDIAALGGNSWRVTVRVTWPGNAVGIVDSIVVVRDENYVQGCV